MSHPVLKSAFDAWRKIQPSGGIPRKVDFKPNSMVGFLAHGFVFEKTKSGKFKDVILGTEARHDSFFDLVGEALPKLTLTENPLEKIDLLDAMLDLKFGCRLNYRLKTLRGVEFDYQILYLPMAGASGEPELIAGAAIPLADYDLLTDEKTLIVESEIIKLSFLDVGFGFPTLVNNTVGSLNEVQPHAMVDASIH